MAMNLRVSQNTRGFKQVKEMLASQEGRRSTEILLLGHYVV
jgi:hypothetical protein